MYRPKVLIADDHAMLRAAFQKLLEQECDVVGCVADGRALLDAAQKLKPDIIVLDIAMPLLNGLDAGYQVKRMMPNVKLIFLTVNEDPEVTRQAFRMGASGYLVKNSAASELSQAIQNVMCGRCYITPLIAKGAEDSFLRGPHERAKEKTPTARQREVLQLLAEGYSMKEVASFLHVKPRTVAFHKYRLMEDLGLRNNAGLIQFAMNYGLVSASARR
jgi:DNA-binding NarL/FixJ family response regulator